MAGVSHQATELVSQVVFLKRDRDVVPSAGREPLHHHDGIGNAGQDPLCVEDGTVQIMMQM